MTKKPHTFRVGDVVRKKEGEREVYVVSGTKGWIHDDFTREDGSRDAWISLAQAMGEVSLLTCASEYELIRKREDVRDDWWTWFTNGEK